MSSISELAVEDAVKAHQRPKLDLYGDMLLVVLKTVRYVDAEELVEVGEILLFVGPDYVISVRHGAASSLSGVREQLEERPDLLQNGPSAVLHAIVDQVVDDYEPVVDRVEGDLQGVEELVFSAQETADPSERIYRLERELLDLHRAVVPLAAAVARLADGDVDLVDGRLHSYFRDVCDHLLRVRGQIEGLRHLLTAVLQANLSQITVRQNDTLRRQNEDLRLISAWVAIIALPTMVFGLYGMNFDHMPELRWRYGFPLVLGVTLALCAALYWRLRRSGWL